jgi:hypothetical protein
MIGSRILGVAVMVAALIGVPALADTTHVKLASAQKSIGSLAVVVADQQGFF